MMADEWEGPGDEGMFGPKPKANGRPAAKPAPADDRSKAVEAENDRLAFLNSRMLARERTYAEVLAAQFTLACQANPERMAEAFAQVFDLSQYEQLNRQILASYSFTRARAAEAQIELDGIKHYAGLMEAQIDRLTNALIDAEEKVRHLRAEIAAARPAATRGGQHKAPGPE